MADQFHIGDIKIARIAWTTADEQPGRVQGDIDWKNTFPDICDMEVADDKLSAKLTMTSLGSGQITGEGDVDLGSGVRLLKAEGNFEVVEKEAEATGSTMTFSDS